MFILQEKNVFIPCDVTSIEFKYVLGGQKHFISTRDEWIMQYEWVSLLNCLL
jgi:hypothetical protein